MMAGMEKLPAQSGPECEVVTGVVVHGMRRGRQLGFPTANVGLPPDHTFSHGVYACRVYLPGDGQGTVYQGCASIGTRPTFGDNPPNLEVYLLDYQGDLYGQEITVSLVGFIRPEERFESVSDLVEAMTSDMERTRRILASG